MIMQATRLRSFVGVLLFAFAVLLGARVYAGVTASISGTVMDPSGAIISGATVTATNVDTGVAVTQPTNTQGYYSFQALPLGKYNIDVQQTGFKSYKQTGVILDVNAALVIDVTLPVGQMAEKVEVESNSLHVETSNTQLGEVIEGKEMTDVPLVTRSYTDLLSLQPGVVASASPMSGAYSGAFISAGFSLPQVSGDQDSGAQSVNGMRESANGFILNGLLVQEIGYSGAGAVPNLDSLAEFRIITNNADAEYGNYAGGLINVVSKSGTNDWHGNAFEFLRNTNLDAANFFESGNRGSYHQNQFGGTFGGPIKKDKIFFFGDYQGNRVIQAVPQVIAGAPSSALEGGDFSGIAAAGGFATSTVVNGFNGGQPIDVPKTVNGDNWATQLSSITGNAVTNGLPYYYRATDYTPASVAAGTPVQYGSACSNPNQCVFPTLSLDPSRFSPIASKLLPYIQPGNNAAQDTFSTNSGKIDLSDNKFSLRGDANTRFGLMTAYYYFDKYNRIDPYWASNAPLYPGFSVDGTGQNHFIALSDTKAVGTAVNEFRLGYFRLDTKFNQPQGGTNTTLADLGFASGNGGAPGIFVGAPTVQGVPEIDFQSFVIGVPSRPNRLTDNIYQAMDNFSKVYGTHTLKFGGQYHFNQLEENLFNVANGNFFFGNTNGGVSETGSDFVDFLLGAPSSYVQGQSYPSYGRNFYFGLYGQDSWRIKSNLTFNYGLRYDVSAPFHEKYNEIQTIIPGQQSLVFPGSPAGWVFPGDSGVPRGLAPTRWNNFAPRLGLAYSFGDHDGVLGKVLGKPGTTSIRAGWGIFYTTFEGATDFNEIGDAPFGNYTGQSNPEFAAPFTNRPSGSSVGNLFPAPAPPKNFSIQNPGSGFPYDTLAHFFGAFGTIGSSPAFYNHNKLPYAEEYELSIQRQITPADLLTVSYVGSEGHHLLSSKSANPGNPALCLSLNNASAVQPGTPTCGPGGENNIYFPASGGSILSTRSVLPGVELPVGTTFADTNGAGTLLPDGRIGIIPFGNDSYFITIGNSAYNSAQINWRHTSGRLQTLLGYTFSKSLDNSSGYGEQINPVNPRLSRALSAFDSTHNFVFSYTYTLPIDKLGGPKRLTNGWQISGITRFATGLPVTMVENDDQSLLGTGFGGPITLAVDTPNYNGQSLGITNPRNNPNHYYFNVADFSQSALGSEGTANRRFFHGPGLNNWDFAVLKNTLITERVNLQFRAELFNVFNHAQFLTPYGITNVGSFGQVTQAAPPRIGQLSLKLNF
jgi:Carboxypeptidase regulatory-like domain